MLQSMTPGTSGKARMLIHSASEVDNVGLARTLMRLGIMESFSETVETS
jgi:hypothetical protein